MSLSPPQVPPETGQTRPSKIAISLIVIAPVLVAVAIVAGIVVLARAKSGDSEDRNSEALERARQRQEVRLAEIAVLKAELSEQTLPPDWNFESEIQAWDSDEWGGVMKIARSAAWGGGRFDKWDILNLLEVDRSELPASLRELFAEERILSGKAIGDFNELIVTSEALTTLRTAALAKICTFRMDLAQDSPNEIVARFNACALLAIRGAIEADRGQFAAALDSFAAAYELAYSAMPEPFLDCHDFGHRMLWVTDACMDGVANKFPDLGQLERRLAPYFERRQDTASLRILFRETIELAPTRFVQSMRDDSTPFEALFASFSDIEYNGLDESGAEFMELLDEPYSKVQERMDNLIYDNEDAFEATTDLLYDMHDTYVDHLRSQAMADVFPLAMSLMRFNAEHGEYPVRIGPETAFQLPVDPIVGTPMIYLRTEEGFIVASPKSDAESSSRRFFYWSTAR